jgi:hypothetical protein
MITAHELARRHDEAVAALWRGDPAPVRTLTTWLAEFRQTAAPDEPAGQPTATSVLGGGGAGIRWYDGENAVVGYVRGASGRYYRVPTSERLPMDDAAGDEGVPDDC